MATSPRVLTLWPTTYNNKPSVRWLAQHRQWERSGLVRLDALNHNAPPHVQVAQAFLFLHQENYRALKPVLRTHYLCTQQTTIAIPSHCLNEIERDLQLQRNTSTHSLLFALQGQRQILEGIAHPPWPDTDEDAWDAFNIASEYLTIHQFVIHDHLGRIRITPHAAQRAAERLGLDLPNQPLKDLVGVIQRLVDHSVPLPDVPSTEQQCRLHRQIRAFKQRKPHLDSLILLAKPPRSHHNTEPHVPLVLCRPREPLRPAQSPHTARPDTSPWFLSTIFPPAPSQPCLRV